MNFPWFFTLFVLFASCADSRNRWSGYREGPFDVGKLLDQFLINVNEHMTNQSDYQLNDFYIAGATGKDVVLSRLDTIVRKGSASVSNQGTIFLANATLGLSECYLKVGSLTYNDKEAPVIFKIEDNSVQIAYSVDLNNKTNCTLSWSTFKLLTFGNVTTFSPDPSFNHADVSQLFSKTVMPELNSHFATTEFMSFLNTNVNPCNQKTPAYEHLTSLQRIYFFL